MKSGFNKKSSTVLALALAGSVLLFSCSKNTEAGSVSSADAQHILGGQEADIAFEKANGVVGIVIISKTANGVSEAICTGSLIGRRTVLTAAHCLLSQNITNVIVTFGPNMQEASKAKAFVPATDAEMNPKFAPTSKGGSFVEGQPWHDSAILMLKSDAPADFQLTQLPTEKDLELLNVKSELTLAGFGVTTPLVNEEKTVNGRTVVTPIEQETDTAGVLRMVTAKVLVATKDNQEIEIDQENGTRGACHGDSGGPAFLKNADGKLIIIGITSRGTNLNGNCDKQNVYTNVYGQLDWIKANLK